MVKLTAVFIVTVCAIGCSGTKPRDTGAPSSMKGMDYSLAAHPAQVRKLWAQNVLGIITDLNVSRDGSAMLVAAAPNPEVEGGGFKHHLTRFGKGGKKSWRIELKAAVKAQVLTDDGSLALVSTYDNELFAVNAKGKKIWSIETMCRPIPLRKQRFLCYHDDDAESDIGFDLYTNKGKKLLSYPVTPDILALKVSDDSRNVAIALTGGQVIFFDPDFRVRWKAKVEGEIIDLAVSSGAQPKVSVLFDLPEASASAPAKSAQKVAVFDRLGSRLADALPAFHVEQLEAVPNGSGIAIYGNSAQGQYLAYFNLPVASGVGGKPILMSEAWRRGDERFADYSSSIIVTSRLVIVGFEDIVANARRSHLVAIDLEGQLKADIALAAEEGTYLYAHGFSPEVSTLGMGTDDGVLTAFQLNEAK